MTALMSSPASQSRDKRTTGSLRRNTRKKLVLSLRKIPAVSNRNDNHYSHLTNEIDLSKSVETIYKNAVKKRVSSSSDDCINLSDETFDLFTLEQAIPQPEDKSLPMDPPQPLTSGYGGVD